VVSPDAVFPSLRDEAATPTGPVVARQGSSRFARAAGAIGATS
jgi:hypothetical protein